MQYHELIRVLLPSPEYSQWQDIFVRSHTRHLLLNNQYTEVNVHEFNTWMNLFAASKYYKYCDLGELHLRLNIKGGYHLQITGSNRNHAFERFDTILVDRYIEEENVEVHVPCAKQYEGVYFTLFENKNKPVEFISASWATDKVPRNNNKLAIVTCTFKREQYIDKTITVYENFIKENPGIKDRMKLFVVDNGKTLDVGKSNEITQIYHNINAGGAGGFTRGLMEVCSLNVDSENGSPYTRVLFMDDDIEIIPESFYRTLVLADYLREEHRQAFIGGSFLNLYQKNHFILAFNFETEDNFRVQEYKSNLNISIFNDVLESNSVSDTMFKNSNLYVNHGWFYCCFDIALVEKKGLPMPFFFKRDDSEWGWRHSGIPLINVNGIFVWHQHYYWKFLGAAEQYYFLRNDFFIKVLYKKKFRNNYTRFLKDQFIYLLKTYDYTNLNIFLYVLDDLLRGSEIFVENPETQFERICRVAGKNQYFDADSNELEQAKHFYPSPGLKRKILYKITCFGKYCPNFLFSNSIALEWYPPVANFMLRKEVKVFNLLTRKYCIRKFDRKAMVHYEKEFYKRFQRIKKEYDNLHNDYCEAHERFKTFNFWNDYLGLRHDS